MDRLTCVPSMVRTRNRFLGSPLRDDELNDLAQDCLTVVWRKLDRYSGRVPLEGWVYRICSLEILNAIRAQRRRPLSHGSALERLPESSRGDGPVETFSTEPIHLALERLGPPTSLIIYHRYFEGRTLPEISDHLSLSLDLVKSRFYRGMKELRRILASHVRGGDS